MGFSFRKRVNLGGGLGMNLSKSGANFSFRTKFGTLGNKGFSVRSGIPGFSYRSRYSGGRNNPLAQMIALFGMFIIVIQLAWYFFLLMLIPWKLLWDLLMAFLDLLLWIGRKIIALFK